MWIRKMQKADIPCLVEMIFRYKRASVPDFAESGKALLARALLDAVKAKNSHPLVCMSEEGVLAGYLLLHIFPFPLLAGKEAYITDLLIAENARGQGTGSSLIGRAEAIAKEQGCVRVMLNNAKESEAFKREFYKKHGYTERIQFANFVKKIE